MWLRTNTKSMQAMAEAFQLVADELDSIMSDYHGTPYNREYLQCQITARMKSLENELRMRRCISETATLRYELEIQHQSVFIYVKPDELYRAALGRMAFG